MNIRRNIVTHKKSIRAHRRGQPDDQSSGRP
jgi:hypothetical protein